MKQKRKNGFFTFICSFLPGAAEMYMGFMKNGLSLMMIFFLSFAPMLFFRFLESLMPISIVIWFFGFFHARNFAGMDDQQFAEAKDVYIWEEFGDFKGFKLPGKNTRIWVAVILIIIGVAQLWEYMSETIYRLIPGDYWDFIYPIVSDIPQVLIAVLLIAIGIRLIVGKKSEIDNYPVVEPVKMPEIPQKQQENTAESKEA